MSYPPVGSTSPDDAYDAAYRLPNTDAQGNPFNMGQHAMNADIIEQIAVTTKARNLMKLYEITNGIRETLDTSDDGELSPEQLGTLDTLGIALDDKINGCCSLIREWEAMNAAKQAEIDRLRAGMDTKANNVKRLKDYMRNCLETIGQTKHETALFRCWVQKSPPSAAFDGDPLDLPEQFRRTKIEPDNKAAIEAWKAQEALPAGFLVNQGTHLRIK